MGFAATEWKLFAKEDPPRVKPLLYVYRVLPTGIHLMRSGEIEANLLRLNEERRQPWIPDLIARKLSEPERGVLDAAEREFHQAEYERLLGELEDAVATTKLPDQPASRDALNDLLLWVRLGR